MSKRLRGIKGRKAIKVFVASGGIKRKGKGGHINIKMPNGLIITIPGTKELKMGLLKDAIRKANLTEEKFLKLLQGG